MFELSNIKCRFSRKFTHIDYFNISCTPLGGSSNSQFEPTNKNSNSKGFLQSAQPYGLKCQFENGANAPKFEPFAKNKAINPEKWEFETEIGKTGTANENIRTLINKTKNEKEKTNSNNITTKTINEVLKTESREEPNTNIKGIARTKIKQTTKTKTKRKATPPTIQKFSNHIKFIDYIPTREIITYRHLFAYGFYVE